jgi:hypothetical protein
VGNKSKQARGMEDMSIEDDEEIDYDAFGEGMTKK